jgi:hypothetical protein
MMPVMIAEFLCRNKGTSGSRIHVFPDKTEKVSVAREMTVLELARCIQSETVCL